MSTQTSEETIPEPLLRRLTQKYVEYCNNENCDSHRAQREADVGNQGAIAEIENSEERLTEPEHEDI